MIKLYRRLLITYSQIQYFSFNTLYNNFKKRQSLRPLSMCLNHCTYWKHSLKPRPWPRPMGVAQWTSTNYTHRSYIETTPIPKVLRQWRSVFNGDMGGRTKLTICAELFAELGRRVPQISVMFKRVQGHDPESPIYHAHLVRTPRILLTWL